jgi:hypothetical protein
MNLILFDFEVFKYDVLLGALVIDENFNITVYQTWGIYDIKKFYNKYNDAIWIGWNNEHYDNLILQTCVKGGNPKQTNDDIIIRNKRHYLNINLNYYDVMKTLVNPFSLKVTEALMGKKISESAVDFNIDRPLDLKEKEEVEVYNLDDLEQTLDNFLYKFEAFSLQLETISEFKLPISSVSDTGTKLAEKVLHAERIDGIEGMVIKPPLYSNLKLKNKKLWDFYINEEFLNGEKLKIDVCKVEHTIGVGGIHGARKKYHSKKALYFDVSGYYNLIMILFDLLPRSIPDEYKKVYEEMYHEQLRLKVVNPKKRLSFKIVLLAVFGAELNEYCKFYDPYKGRLVTMTGQIFLVDLLEKLEDKIELVQSNTDGIIAVPLEGVEIIKEWENRTGFNLKIDYIENIYQRDVNCYMYTKGGKIETRGGDISEYKQDNPFSSQKEPPIIGEGIVEYFLLNKKPEDVVEENKYNLRKFQYIGKKASFKYLELQENYLDGKINIVKSQNVNRAFASNDVIQRTLYKCNPQGKVKRAKMQNFPNNIFIYNDEILSKKTTSELVSKIDYDYYVKKIYDKIKEFMDIPHIKKVII